MQAVMEANSYLEHTAPLLKAQGSVMVFNRQQENRITDLARLSEAANTALTNNARDLEQNAQAVVELSLNGGITVETLKELDSALRRGMTIFQKGREQQQQKIAKETHKNNVTTIEIGETDLKDEVIADYLEKINNLKSIIKWQHYKTLENILCSCSL